MTPVMEKGVGVIFMGGKASRLGGISKADIRAGGRTCFDRVYEELSAHLETVAVSVAEPLDLDIPTIIDWPSDENDGGVVFSVLAVLKWAAESGFDYAVTSACDTPFLPKGFAAQLNQASGGKKPVVCKSNGRTHGLHALWPVSIFETLKSLVLKEGERKIGRIHELLDSQAIAFETERVDPFFNINTPDDLKQAEIVAKQFGL